MRLIRRCFTTARTHYETLGLASSVSHSSCEIRAAFLTSAKRTHPDATGGSDVSFQRVNTAYDVLSKREAKREYDASLGLGAWSPSASSQQTEEDDEAAARGRGPRAARSNRWDLRADASARAAGGGLRGGKGARVFNHDLWRHAHFGDAMPESAPRLDATWRGAQDSAARATPQLTPAARAHLKLRKAEEKRRRERIRTQAARAGFEEPP